MADQKISGLPPDTDIDDNHYVLLNDPTGPTTKRTTLGTIRLWLQTFTAWIRSNNIDWSTAGGIWWQELGRATVLTGTSTQLTVNLPSAKKYLNVIVVQHSGGSALTSILRFNNDGAGNYDQRTQENASADAVTNGQFGVNLGSNSLDGMHAEYYIDNEALYTKIAHGFVTFWSAGAGQIYRNLQANKWNNTSAQISRIDLVATGGAYRPGTELIVLGHD